MLPRRTTSDERAAGCADCAGRLGCVDLTLPLGCNMLAARINPASYTDCADHPHKMSLHHGLTTVKPWCKVREEGQFMQKFVAYYRVSTKRQGKSGLGLEAQREAVARHIAAHGGKLVAEYVEVESGKLKDRPQLAAALAHARGKSATLVIAKLDRLARNVAFVAALMESGCEFVACDNPTASRLTVHILAAVAEAEANAISERTTAALAAARRRGVKLGTARPGHSIDWRKGQRKGLAKAVAAASAKRSQAATDAYGHLMADVWAWRDAGESLGAIAGRLNAAGERTTAGGEFHAVAVHRLLQRSCRS